MGNGDEKTVRIEQLTAMAYKQGLRAGREEALPYKEQIVERIYKRIIAKDGERDDPWPAKSDWRKWLRWCLGVVEPEPDNRQCGACRWWVLYPATFPGARMMCVGPKFSFTAARRDDKSCCEHWELRKKTLPTEPAERPFWENCVGCRQWDPIPGRCMEAVEPNMEACVRHPRHHEERESPETLKSGEYPKCKECRFRNGETGLCIGKQRFEEDGYPECYVLDDPAECGQCLNWHGSERRCEEFDCHYA